MSSVRSPGDAGAGAGLALTSKASRPDGVPLKKGEYSVASRALAMGSYFLSGVLAINLSQFLGTPLYLVNQDWYNAWIAFTKQSFGLLTMTLTQTFAPTVVVVSGDQSVRGQLLRKTDGTLLLDFPERIVLIANHQIYTDWLYLWWTAYCSGMHGRLYIMLKESLKRIPVIGWGMQLNQFIFLKRNWEKDRPHMAEALGRLNKIAEPMWLLLFPEGTNLAPNTREKSASWAKKSGLKDMRHCLLPRSTGLGFCLQELKDTVDYLYDCTIAYEGVPRGQYAQDIFTLKAGYLEGRPPKSVSMYWRRFAIKDIPIHHQEAFDLWLTARWREKDLLIENYLIHGHFPSDNGVSRTPAGKTKRGCGLLEVPIRSSHWYEFLQIFAPMGILAMVIYTFYGALPQKFWKAANGQALKTGAADIKKLKSSAPTFSSSLSLDSFFDKDQQGQTFGNAGMALAKWVQSPEAKRVMNRADTVQKWLEDPQKVLVDTIVKKPEQKSFFKSLREEEAQRRQAKAGPHRGTFWRDLENVESSRNGSVASATATTMVQGGKGTFWHDLNKSQTKRIKPVSSVPKKKGDFWDQVNKEETSRYGTVMTLSSDSSTAVNSVRSAPTAIGRTTKPKSLAKSGIATTAKAVTAALPKTSNTKPATVPKANQLNKAPSKPPIAKAMPPSPPKPIKKIPATTTTPAKSSVPNSTSPSTVKKSVTPTAGAQSKPKIGVSPVKKATPIANKTSSPPNPGTVTKSALSKTTPVRSKSVGTTQPKKPSSNVVKPKAAAPKLAVQKN